ncbi:MAG: T9SS type A sorting domain-containing protein [Bacteroidales bacterium]|nr:T9SS type A sorting domain-containing protein [Bacteroidales bacterium]
MKKILAILLGIFLMVSLKAQNPGDLDLNYGEYGISIPEFYYNNFLNDIDIMSDDKIVTGGYYIDGSLDYGLLSYKLNTDGSLAPFGASTWFNYQLGFDEEKIMATYVLPDDKILIAGYTYSSGGGFVYYFVMRLLPDGNPDTDFGTGGISNAAGIDIEPRSISVHYGLSGDYSIYVCGYTINAMVEPTILKLDQDGQIVSSFGTDGQFVLSRPGAIYKDIYLYNFSGNSYIYAAGNDLDGTNAFVSKHDIITGELENSFNTDGIFNFTHPTGILIEASKLVFHSTLTNNTIALFGQYKHSDGDYDMYAIRLNCADGSLDNNFGIGGWSSLRAPDSQEFISDAILQNTDDKYYFGGSTNANGNFDFMLGRLLNNGFFDTSFGINGLVLTDISDDMDMLNGIALNADQSRIYGGGRAYHFSNNYGTIACYYTGLGVGISDSDVSQQEISIYPNPAQDLIHISTSLEGNYLIDVLSPEGKLIIQESQAGKDLHINIQHLEKGIYFLKLSRDNLHHTSKIIKH